MFALNVYLTDLYIASIPLPKSRYTRKEIFDSYVTGLSIRISPTGTKSWRYAYRLDGKLTRPTLGNYPEYSIQEAREWARELKRLTGRYSTYKNQLPCTEDYSI